MTIHTYAGRDVIKEDPLLSLQLARVERQCMRGRERQDVARNAQRFPRRAAPPRLERLERTRTGEVNGIGTCELRTSHDVRDRRERPLEVRRLQRFPHLLAQ